MEMKNTLFNRLPFYFYNNVYEHFDVRIRTNSFWVFLTCVTCELRIIKKVYVLRMYINQSIFKIYKNDTCIINTRSDILNTLNFYKTVHF